MTSIEDIRKVMSRLDEAAANISVAVEEQNASTKEISRAANEAASSTAAAATTIAQVRSTVAETGQATGGFLSVAGKLSQQSETLREELDGLLTRMRASN